MQILVEHKYPPLVVASYSSIVLTEPQQLRMNELTQRLRWQHWVWTGVLTTEGLMLYTLCSMWMQKPPWTAKCCRQGQMEKCCQKSIKNDQSTRHIQTENKGKKTCITTLLAFTLEIHSICMTGCPCLINEPMFTKQLVHIHIYGTRPMLHQWTPADNSSSL